MNTTTLVCMVVFRFTLRLLHPWINSIFALGKRLDGTQSISKMGGEDISQNAPDGSHPGSPSRSLSPYWLNYQNSEHRDAKSLRSW